MSSAELERLRVAMAREPRPTPFIGAGFSSAVTGDADCATWRSLLLNGTAVCEDKVPDLPDGWADWVKKGLENGDAKTYVTLADDISQRLRSIRGGKEFSAWMNGTVGKLAPTPEGRQLIEAVRSLSNIIVTTNYDTLIEGLDPKWTAYTWTDEEYELAVRKERSVLHLHGIANNSRSIILGSADYQRLNSTELNQILSKALFASHRFIFIGCGDGLSDPDIAPLIEFAKKALPDSTEHYILVKDDQVRKYNERPLSPQIVPVAYGPDYADLLVFLQRLAKDEKVTVNEHTGSSTQSSPTSATAPLALAATAKEKLKKALDAFDHTNEAMRLVERRRAVSEEMDEWDYGEQEAEHVQLAAALLDPVTNLGNSSARAIQAFEEAEADFWRLMIPKFVSRIARLAPITEIVSELERELEQLLLRVTRARDDLHTRIEICADYRSPYQTLSRTHEAIEQTYRNTASLREALNLPRSVQHPKNEEAARQETKQTDPAPSAGQGGTSSTETWDIRVAGKAAAGSANLATVEDDDSVWIPPQNASRDKVIAVKVEGDSMIGDDLLDGDYAIVDRGRESRNGEIAVVRKGGPDDTETTVKRVWQEEIGLRLEPSNPKYESEIWNWNEDPFIEGPVIGVFRQVKRRRSQVQSPTAANKSGAANQQGRASRSPKA